MMFIGTKIRQYFYKLTVFAEFNTKKEPTLTSRLLLSDTITYKCNHRPQAP